MNNGKYDKMISVIDMEMPNRKPNRIAGYDYSQSGAYFITICTQDRKKILSRIFVGTPREVCHYEDIGDCPVCGNIQTVLQQRIRQ